MSEITTKKIEERQNEEEPLKVQFAARKCFNVAETLNNTAWILYWFEIVILLISKKYNFVAVPPMVPIIFNIMLFLVICGVSYFTNKATWLRGFFDEYVLCLKTEKYPSHIAIKVKRFSDIVKRIFQKQYEKQTSNTENGVPPGVKCWYDTSCYKEGDDAIFDCQQQNLWFTKASFVVTMIIRIISIIVNISVLVWFISICGVDGEVIIALFGIGIRIIERIYANLKFIYIVAKLAGIEESMCYSKNSASINNLQDNINELRSTPVFGCNIVYEKIVKYIAALYRK